MKLRAILCSLALLGACARAPETASAPATEAAPLSTLNGSFIAMSNTATGVTGDVTLEGARLTFSKGGSVETAAGIARDPNDAIGKDQPSFAQTYIGPTSLTLDVRRVVAERGMSLCGALTPATYLALAHDEPATAVTLLVFSGDEPPGPNATRSTLCATFSYVKP